MVCVTQFVLTLFLRRLSRFPTIYWAPANRKSSPKKYSGGREVDDFFNFIKKESTKPVSLKKKSEL